MNQSDPSCHQIPNFPHLFVDAFRTHRHRTASSLNAFVLTHYHGDHYCGLPRDGMYEGPACVHCTPVTAALLREVHGVRAAFVVEHEYGETWTWPPPNSRPSTGSTRGTADPADGVDGTEVEAEAGRKGGGGEAEGTAADKSAKDETSSSTNFAEVTFYDANHCPGAAIVLIKVVTTSSDGHGGPSQTTTYHLHTGDMRYHPKMREYPLLREVASGRMLDRLYLDTTYAHPKHDFVPQDVAVETVASAVEGLLLPGLVSPDTDAHKAADAKEQPIAASPSRSRTLVLLSCYSIGKEKVLHSSASRSGQKLYVTDKKLRMLRCVGRGRDGRREEASSCNDVIDMCTTDPNSSDLHVVPMGRAGELWPYFRPNYNACARYARELERRYDRVVAFIPTGWADASNWNRKNAVCRRTVSLEGGNGEPNEGEEEAKINVEIRLVAYSEHSSCGELEDFVDFVKPRKVVPTVYSNEKDKRAIEKRFEKFVDLRRAKRSFVDFINSAASSPGCRNNGRDDGNGGMKSSPVGIDRLRCVGGASSSSVSSKSSSSTCGGDNTGASTNRGAAKGDKNCSAGAQISGDDDGGSATEVTVVDMTGDEDIDGDGVVSDVSKPQHWRSCSSDRGDSSPYGPNVGTLLAMGFDGSSAREAVVHCGGDVERAVERLLVRGSAAVGHDGDDGRIEPALTSSSSGHDRQTRLAQSDGKTKRGRSWSSSPSSTITSYFQRKRTHRN